METEGNGIFHFCTFLPSPKYNPMADEKYRKEAVLALWDTFHFGDMGSCRTVCPGQMLSLLDS